MPPHSQQASVLPPQSQQHTSTGLGNTGGENDYAFNNLMINASTLGSISDNQQELGERDLGELLYGSTCATPYQLQGREETMNPKFGGNVNPVDDYYPSFEKASLLDINHCQLPG
ncbi:hypothetical protein GH714_027042 [Hevea brasiliensis]|uniref:Uncharacterized protein n=1 Tax=Hevea brasiliensis TaxID=3981 RepID=A0A6A6MHM3_HEVBR|nr:hypothetical protein GH714_027042 [Hevea brasiliensis]